ncbi:MAG: alcohol dehydrogenase catalytic domain-containing protein [Anaerolineales bacterium]|nr:alcohol dehydrogenase catalytic domain-containing protein [Anaerolineales bacterium]
MKQAIMIEPGKIEFRDVPKPEISDDQVLIAVKRIGVCGSDIHVYHGLHPYTPYPVVQGHEVSGVIAEVGQDVQWIEVGSIATFTPQVVCGRCYPCRTGRYHICDHLKVMGFQTGGAAQEYFPVDADKVVVMPSGFTLDQAALIEPLAVGVHAVQRAGDVAGKGVLVLGAGTIGSMVAQSARALGAEKILLTDISPYKLEKARECGFKHAINPMEADLAGEIEAVFGPDKMDVVFECVGVQATITQAVENARKGSDIIVVGVFGQEPHVNLGFVQDRELRLIGTLMYQRTDYETAVLLVAEGKIHLEPMITHRFAFEEYQLAYEAIENSNGEYMKVMIELGS